MPKPRAQKSSQSSRPDISPGDKVYFEEEMYCHFDDRYYSRRIEGTLIGFASPAAAKAGHGDVAYVEILYVNKFGSAVIIRTVKITHLRRSI